MAIVYYPSRLDKKGQTSQYVVPDNSKYVTTGATGNSTPTASILTHTPKSSSPLLVYQDGLFVITAAGTDRFYFSTSSVSNF
jgi:hypothetical protein